MASSQGNGWIGVDLDGTLAEYHGWQGIEHIGKPVPLMMQRVKSWIAEGKWVKIFTARVITPEAIPFIKRWLVDNGLGELEITNIKDFDMIELWDDRCISIELNTGEIMWTEYDDEATPDTIRSE